MKKIKIGISWKSSTKAFADKNILSVPRIGVDYAGDDANLLYRFYLKSNKWVSKNG